MSQKIKSVLSGYATYAEKITRKMLKYTPNIMDDEAMKDQEIHKNAGDTAALVYRMKQNQTNLIRNSTILGEFANLKNVFDASKYMISTSNDESVLKQEEKEAYYKGTQYVRENMYKNIKCMYVYALTAACVGSGNCGENTALSFCMLCTLYEDMYADLKNACLQDDYFRTNIGNIGTMENDFEHKVTLNLYYVYDKIDHCYSLLSVSYKEKNTDGSETWNIKYVCVCDSWNQVVAIAEPITIAGKPSYMFEFVDNYEAKDRGAITVDADSMSRNEDFFSESLQRCLKNENITAIFSRKDMQELATLMKKDSTWDMQHIGDFITNILEEHDCMPFSKEELDKQYAASQAYGSGRYDGAKLIRRGSMTSEMDFFKFTPMTPCSNDIIEMVNTLSSGSTRDKVIEAVSNAYWKKNPTIVNQVMSTISSSIGSVLNNVRFWS